DRRDGLTSFFRRGGRKAAPFSLAPALPLRARVPGHARRMGSHRPTRARRLAGLAWTLLWLSVLGLALAWAWQHPAAQRARLALELAREPAPQALPVPVQGVAAGSIAPTWGAPR